MMKALDNTNRENVMNEELKDAKRDLLHIGAYLDKSGAPDTVINRLKSVQDYLATPTATSSEAAAPADLRKSYVKDMEDTLSQVGVLVGVSNDADALIAAVKNLTVAPTDRDALAEAIHAAAVKRGIIGAGTVVSGPQLLMLCGDLAASSEAAAPDLSGLTLYHHNEFSKEIHDDPCGEFYLVADVHAAISKSPTSLAGSGEKGESK